MEANGYHLVFYDGNCSFCNFWVRFLLQRDRQNKFVFAPLGGKTALKFLKESPRSSSVDSLVLVQGYRSKSPKVLLFGKAALRIFWLLGGAWQFLGVFSFLPSFLYDWIYKIIAANRRYILPDRICLLPEQKDRKKFLP